MFNFTQNGKHRGLNTFWSVIDFFFPIGNYLRIDMIGNSNNFREFYTFRCFVVHYFYEFFINPAKKLSLKLNIPLRFAYQIGALAVDASDEQGTPPTSGTTTSYSHTCTGSDRILVSGVYDDNAGTIGAWTYPGGTNLTVDITQTAQLTRVRLAHLLAPATGANTLLYTLAGSGVYSTNEKGYIFGISFTGAKQSGQPDATVGESANAASASASITTVADNCFVIDVIAVNTNPITKGASQTVITGADTGIANNASAEFGGSYKSVGVAGAYTMTWSWTSSFGYDHAAMSVSPAAVIASGAPVMSLMGIGG